MPKAPKFDQYRQHNIGLTRMQDSLASERRLEDFRRTYGPLFLRGIMAVQVDG